MEWNINNSLNESKLYAVIILTETGNLAFELVHCFQLAYNRNLAAPCTSLCLMDSYQGSQNQHSNKL